MLLKYTERGNYSLHVFIIFKERKNESSTQGFITTIKSLKNQEKEKK